MLKVILTPLLPINLTMKLLYLLPLLLILGFISFRQKPYEEAKLELAFREIGYKVLKSNGPNEGRVLPIKTISNNIFQVHFNQEIAIAADSIVQIAKEVIKKNELNDNYLVNVKSCSTDQTVYGFSVFLEQSKDIVACKGSHIPKSCLYVELIRESSFEQSWWALLGICSLLGIFTFLYARNTRKIKSPTTFLDEKEQMLRIGDQEIPLSRTEFRIMTIFLAEIGEIVDRNKIQKEVWEDEGVIVGRSLDTFISKLRKKIEPHYLIKNIHGKGYRLEFSEEK